MPRAVREITDESFEQDVLHADGVVVVDFWAPWCRPCRAIAPILEQFEQETAGRIAFAKMNIDEHPQAASRYGVMSIPTVMLFEDGEPQQTVVGVRPRSHFEQAWAPWLTAPSTA
jgi:thioredoxin 1